ncbi:hypothetical protein [Gillisia sp. Hel_I_86]|uniref:hypothetical protein n=1 Tax=Gillisia sp. Hel_I_86 TaxID=1249981 RepID=UPI0011A9C273|nr:hypothetical protein [Gillisia sp. Hel_I_86]
MKEQKKHLYYLNELSDYKVDSHYPDVRGWSVKDRDNRVIGKVDNLLVNKNLMKVVYLDVEVDKTILDANYDPYRNAQNSGVREFVNKEGENHVIVPIGMVHIHEEQKYVHTESINHQTFAETKRYKTGDNVDREYEVFVMDSYNRHSKKHAVMQDTPDPIAHKESPYRADREADRMENNNENLNTDIEWSEERRKLEVERHKLREERLKLEEERRRLETERNLRDRNPDSNTQRDTSNQDARRGRNISSDDLFPDDDSFYDRGEFERKNYRKS